MVKEAQDMAKVKGLVDISPAMLEGFAAAKVLVEGLQRAGPKPNREKCQAVLEGICKFDPGGLELSRVPMTMPTGISPTCRSLALTANSSANDARHFSRCKRTDTAKSERHSALL